MPVNDRSAESQAWVDIWQRIEDCTGNTDTVKSPGPKYLPVLPGHDRHYPLPDGGTIDQYADIFLRYAVWLPYSRKVKQGMLGLLFRKPVQGDGLGVADPHRNNVTLEGHTLDRFAGIVASERLSRGWGGVLVDYSSEAGRPYQRLYSAPSVLDWRIEYRGGVPWLTQVRVLESFDVPSQDGWSVEKRQQVRVLALAPVSAVAEQLAADGATAPDGFGQLSNESDYPLGVYVQQVWRRVVLENGKEGDTWERYGPPVTPMRSGRHLWFVPFTFLARELESPPLQDVVDLNLAHYRTSADYRALMHKFGHPTLLLTGFDGDKDTVRVGGLIRTSVTEADGKYIELTGVNARELRESMSELKAEMAIVAARMLLAEQKKAAETAESQEFRMAGDDATLSAIALDVSDTLTQSFVWHRWWAGTETIERCEAEVDVKLNREFFARSMSAVELQTFWLTHLDGGLSRDAYEAIKARGGLLPDGVTAEEERQLADASKPAPVEAPMFADDGDADA